ncbi:MAG: FixH family protein [Thiogranum sp.]|nr:FixH family protein [Thiogranum sp.]
MQEQTLDRDTQPWYRQGWPWALIALPASAVVAGIITLILAIQSPNALVVDDYYKEGLAINQQKQRLAAADAAGLRALLRYDRRQVQLTLDSSPAVAGDTVKLQIIHATRAELDQTLTLQRSGDVYRGEVEELQAGSWYLRLQPADLAWEVRGALRIEGPFQTLLTAQDY